MVRDAVSSRWHALPPSLRQLTSFFAGSLLGLLVDLCGFQLLVLIGLAAAAANVCSSTTSVVVVYLLVTRYTFGSRRAPHTFALFVGWYATNILVTSALIGLAVGVLGGPPIGWKLVSIPLSFAANSLFSRTLFTWAARAQSRGQS